jgi:molecular chaperone HtpG
LVTETPAEDVIDTAIDQLFENQLLIEGLHPNPTDMIPRIQKLMEAATAREAD